MKPEKDLPEVMSTRLRDIVFSATNGQVLLIFDEGFLTLGIDGYDNDEITIDMLDLSDFGDHLLVDAGIVTHAELEARRVAIRKAQVHDQNKRELVEYNRLKAKYEQR